MIVNYFSKKLLLISFVGLISGLIVISSLSQFAHAYTIADCPADEQPVTTPGEMGPFSCHGPVSTCWNNGMTWDFATSTCSGTATTAAPTASSGSSAVPSSQSYTCSKAMKFLTFPPWYRGLNVGAGDTKADCEIVSPGVIGLSNFIWRVVLNVIDIALQLAGYIAVGFILYGGFAMITSNGSPEGVTRARQSILNAVIGLAISISAVVIVNLIMGIIN